jgi:hypothetical protein
VRKFCKAERTIEGRYRSSLIQFGKFIAIKIIEFMVLIFKNMNTEEREVLPRKKMCYWKENIMSCEKVGAFTVKTGSTLKVIRFI